MRVAIHHFKRALLPDHLPDLHQATEVFLALEKFGFIEEPEDRRSALPTTARLTKPIRLWTGRTWQKWFSDDVTAPKLQKLELLDRAASSAIRWIRPCDQAVLSLDPEFYARMVDGGLLKSMLARVKGQYSIHLLRERAAAYRPLSAWHLHLDALELRTFSDAVPGVENEEIVTIAGERIFEILFSLWGRRSYPEVRESIYVGLASSRVNAWNALSAAEQASQFEDPAFALFDDPDQAMLGCLASKPDRDLLDAEGGAPPARVYRLLFAIGADTQFLQGDALTAWSFDLGTACVAGIALFFAGSPNVTPHSEQVVLNAIDSVLFGLHDNGVAVEHRANLWGGDVDEALQDAMREVKAKWESAGPLNFHHARKAYEAEMEGLGIRVTDIYSVQPRS